MEIYGTIVQPFGRDYRCVDVDSNTRRRHLKAARSQLAAWSVFRYYDSNIFNMLVHYPDMRRQAAMKSRNEEAALYGDSAIEMMDEYSLWEMYTFGSAANDSSGRHVSGAGISETASSRCTPSVVFNGAFGVSLYRMVII